MIGLVIMIIFMLPYLLLSTDQIANVYGLMVCKAFLPLFVTFFLLFCGLLEQVYLKLQVLEIITSA